MAAEVADVPRGRRAAARQLGDDVDHRDEGQLHAAEALGLVIAEEPGLVQQLLVLGQQHARVLAFLRTLAQRGHDLARAAHGLVIADVREVHPPERISTSRSTGSSATAISFSTSSPQPGQQNWRNCGVGSMKRFGSPTIGFAAWIGRSLRTQ